MVPCEDARVRVPKLHTHVSEGLVCGFVEVVEVGVDKVERAGDAHEAAEAREAEELRMVEAYVLVINHTS